MSRGKASVIIVCEDVQQQAFARRYLTSRGFNKDKFRVIFRKPGTGSGEQFVREQLVDEIKMFRRNVSYGKDGIRLVALIDADAMAVQERMKQIESALEQAGIERIKPDERIAIFIPKRNIETWIRYANDGKIDEDTSYRKLMRPKDCQNAVDLYVKEICQRGIPEDGPSSLIHACKELLRIL